MTVLAQAWVVGMLHWELILGSPCLQIQVAAAEEWVGMGALHNYSVVFALMGCVGQAQFALADNPFPRLA